MPVAPKVVRQRALRHEKIARVQIRRALVHLRRAARLRLRATKRARMLKG